MERKHIKKIAMILTVLVTLGLFGSFTLGTEHSTNGVEISGENIELGEIPVEQTQNTEDYKDNKELLEDANLNDASETILENVSNADRKKAEYIDKYGGDKLLGLVAYYLGMAQRYSWPFCFIGITIGAFNFLILGNKKLDKKEQGFGWIVGFTMALVVFNVLPLLYAVLVAGK